MNAACSSSPAEGMACPPIASTDLDDLNYQDVVSRFEDAGFANVETEAIKDLITGWLTSDGEVEDVSIDGRTKFSTSDEFSLGAKVVVRYHAFPDDSSEEVGGGSAGNEGDRSPSSGEPDSTSSSGLEAGKERSLENITAANNPDFAALLLLTDQFDPSITSFAEAHIGQTVEFDGFVAAIAPHRGYKTRFDYLINAGDFDPNCSTGPYFQFSDVNYSSFNFVAESAPDSVQIGMNLHIVAELGAFDESNSLYQLKPIETSLR